VNIKWTISDDGEWSFAEPLPLTFNPIYSRDLPRYLTAFNRLFEAAKAKSEFDFILALVHKERDLYSDPFETTKRIFPKIIALHASLPNYDLEVTIGLWLYGHIVESYYPYQVVADLIHIASGHPHRTLVFERDGDGAELSPGRKIQQLRQLTSDPIHRAALRPFRESWNANLRNAVFHSNYTIVGDKVRLPGMRTEMPVITVMSRVNRSVAAFEALLHVEDYHRRRYTRPVEIEAPVYFAHEAGTSVTVLVRDNYGPVGIYSTVRDIDVESPVILGRMTRSEYELVQKGIFHFPAARSD